MSSRHIQPHGDWLHPWEQQGSRLAFSRVNFTSTLVGGSQARVNSSNLGWKMFCQLSLAANNANNLGQRQKWVTQLIAVLPFPQLPTLLASKEESIVRIFFFYILILEVSFVYYYHHFSFPLCTYFSFPSSSLTHVFKHLWIPVGMHRFAGVLEKPRWTGQFLSSESLHCSREDKTQSENIISEEEHYEC